MDFYVIICYNEKKGETEKGMIYNFDDLSFGILTIDRFFHKEGKFNVKARPYAALSFRESGEGVFKIGDKTFVTKPGDVLFIPADVPYEVDYSVSESIVANLQFCNYTEAESFELRASAGIQALFLQLLEEWSSGYSVNRAKSTIYGILEKIREYRDVTGADAAFAAAFQYIERHFCDSGLDVASVCESAFISPSTLQRLFIKHFGISPKQYIIKLRMNKALGMLAEGEKSVREIASACGFLDEKYFSRAFRKKYGYPPSRLRDNMII